MAEKLRTTCTICLANILILTLITGVIYMIINHRNLEKNNIV